MTNEQLKVVSEFYDLYKQNCERYSTDEYGQFNTLMNENGTDKNIVIISTLIDGYNDNYIPVTETKNFLVEPNGNYYEMDMMKEVFRNNTEIITYLQKLTNFNFNAK